MKRVFVDSGAFFAQIVAEDEHHARAAATFELASRDRWRLVTTNAVVHEAYTLLLVRSRPGRANALRLLDVVFGDPYRIGTSASMAASPWSSVLDLGGGQGGPPRRCAVV